MGFTNVVAEAQRRMLAVARDIFLEKCEPYIDDNPIKGTQNKDETEVQPGIRKFVWDHLHDIKDLLQRFLVERIAGLRNRADGLSRVCITPEGVEDAEPIDAFLKYEGGTLAVDNEMAGTAPTMDHLLIQTLEKGAPAIVAELGEGSVVTFRRKDEKDSWGAMMGPKEELMAMAVEGGRDAVMNRAETWTQRERRYLVNQAQEGQDTDQKGREFFLIEMYDGIFREIDLLLIGNKQPMQVSLRAREEVGKYVLRNGHLFKKEEGMMPRRVVCERSRQLDIIQAMHEGLAGGHRSSKGTLAKITPLYFWPGMAGMVATYCQTCLICQERSSARVFEPLRPTRVLGPGHLVHLDLAVMHVSTDGYRYILDARDNLSGYVEAVTFKKKTGKGVADWIEDFYLRHPFVRRFIADNGTKFINQEVLGRLKALLDDNPHMSTKELIAARCQQVVRNEEALEDVVRRVMDSRMRDKGTWDQVKNIRKEPLQAGEKVLVRNSAFESTWSGQLGRRFKGPYRIAKRVGLNTFELKDLDSTRIKGSFPGQRLIMFFNTERVEQWLQEAKDTEKGELTT
ncbi:hypothetical protein CBR_g79938 [Chara braunii]|uniref:Integrase zinc-binding domain-containing protein n=1 Tax=Chara braunii TaxID=69332 RepID=A0A388JL08_CHABU|nr:hypothetical protein CBR_g79938 [Chara braunii]|eukprot:GBG46531.1 hypothetical protein CBR_g79938 [Chara braunii]